MQMQSRALPRQTSLWRELQGFVAPTSREPAISHSVLIYAIAVLLLFLAIVAIDLNGPALQAIGLAGHATAIDPIFMGP